MAEVDLGAVAAGGGTQPEHRLGEQPRLVRGWFGGRGHGVPAAHAQVVCAALERSEAQAFAAAFDGLERIDEDGHVFLEKLLLQVDGVGGDYDTLAVGEGVEGGGKQVRQRLADACARLDDDALAIVDRLGDCLRHFRLLGTRLEAVQRLGERAALAEH